MKTLSIEHIKRNYDLPSDPKNYQVYFNALDQNNEWHNVFAFASSSYNKHKDYSMDDIESVICAVDGYMDGNSATTDDNWIGIFKMSDGKYMYLTAGCDYTGFDCQCWGDCRVYDTLKEAINFGCTETCRERLGLELTL